jgi:hypothetical protein
MTTTTRKISRANLCWFNVKIDEGQTHAEDRRHPSQSAIEVGCFLEGNLLLAESFINQCSEIPQLAFCPSVHYLLRGAAQRSNRPASNPVPMQ